MYDTVQPFSVVIPVYNEVHILSSELPAFCEFLEALYGKRFQLLLVENGSQDGSIELCDSLAEIHEAVDVIHLPEASFGAAVRQCVLGARYEHIVLLNADWLDESFIERALPLLHDNDIVIGSKTVDPSLDRRPFRRKLGSRLLTAVLRHGFGFQGSDSHGLKAFNKKSVTSLIERCRSNEIIESELLLLAQRNKLRIAEIAVAISELRPPRVSFYRRFGVMGRELWQLHHLRKTHAKTAAREHALHDHS